MSWHINAELIIGAPRILSPPSTYGTWASAPGTTTWHTGISMFAPGSFSPHRRKKNKSSVPSHQRTQCHR
eukprot:scaffold510700_cov26-Prasinocladus_malaysianus.AAC.1